MSKLHLILPMAGRGSRFFENGFICPKPLIEIAGKPFFYWAARSIEKYVDCAEITFVVLEEHIRDFAIDAKIKAYWPNARIIALPAVTEGAAITALRGAEGLPDGEPLLFNDCDHLFLCRSFNEFCRRGDFANGPDGALLTFESDSPAYSYLQTARTATSATRWKSRSSATMPSAVHITSRISRPTPTPAPPT